MNEQIKAQLQKADELLGAISVSGNSVYLMVSARNALKAAYDLLLNDREEENDGR